MDAAERGEPRTQLLQTLEKAKGRTLREDPAWAS